MTAWRNRVAALLREPLVHFLIAGALLFVVLAGRAPDVGERRIVVDEAVVTGLVNRYVQAFRRPPSDEELDGLIRDYVRGEVYYREALRLGLDQDDEVVSAMAAVNPRRSFPTIVVGGSRVITGFDEKALREALG